MMIFNKLVVFAAVLVCCTGLPASAADEFALMHAESLGPLKLGQGKKEALANLQSKPRVGRMEEWAADGGVHQRFDFPAEGVSLSFVSDTRRSPQQLDSIRIRAPSSLTTKAGIHIGSASAEVAKAYRAHFNKEESQPGQTFVAGSIYGGLIFSFKADKVDQIFLGAAAE